MPVSQRRLTSVELVFENVESYAVPVKSISGLTMNGIQKSYDYNDEDHSLTSQYTADYLELTLDTKFLMSLKADQYYVDEDDQDSNSVPNLLQRILMYNDLVALDLHFTDGHDEYVNVYWGEFGDDVNSAMQCSATISGELKIICSSMYDDSKLNAYDNDDAWKAFKYHANHLYEALTRDSDDEAFTEALDEVWPKLNWDKLDKFLSKKIDPVVKDKPLVKQKLTLSRLDVLSALGLDDWLYDQLQYYPRVTNSEIVNPKLVEYLETWLKDHNLDAVVVLAKSFLADKITINITNDRLDEDKQQVTEKS